MHSTGSIAADAEAAFGELSVQVEMVSIPATLRGSHAANVRRKLNLDHWLNQFALPRVSILTLNRGGSVYCVPIRQADAELARRFAPSEENLIAWARDQDVQWWGADRESTFWSTCGMEAPNPEFWPSLRAHLQKLRRGPARIGLTAILTAARESYESVSDQVEFYPERDEPDVARRRAMISLSARDPEISPWFHKIEASDPYSTSFPYLFEKPSRLRPILDLTARRRSVAFIIPSYYNFLYLSKALRARGWDAITFSPYDPAGPTAKFGHGGDVSLFDPDPDHRQNLISDAYRMISERFGIMHFYGVGTLSVFPQYQDASPKHDALPWDLLDAKRRGIKVGYSHTGCMDAVSQTSFRRWSSNMCGLCPWEKRPEICSDDGNLAWGWKLSVLADLICAETEVLLDFKVGRNVYRDPLTFALDPDIWRPNLDTSSLPYPRTTPDEVLVYHAVGNYEARLREGRNVKGTSAVIQAVNRLRSEGHVVSLMRFQELPSRQNILMQAQADIVVDQLNYGRYGATAREGMMLGKPVVGRVIQDEPVGPRSRCIEETPIVHADESTIYAVLRDLVLSPGRRQEIGVRSHQHALKWWSADNLAEKFERVWDHIQIHGHPPEQD